MSAVALAVAAGAGAGSAARWAVSVAAAGAFGPDPAWPLLAVNGAGAFAIGLWAAAKGPEAPRPAPPAVQALVTTGFCGGFTTFSLFSLEALRLAQAGLPGAAAAFVAGSLVAWAAGVAAGYRLGRRLG